MQTIGQISVIVVWNYMINILISHSAFLYGFLCQCVLFNDLTGPHLGYICTRSKGAIRSLWRGKKATVNSFFFIHTQPHQPKCGPLSTRNKSVRFCRCEGLFTKMKGSSFQIDSGNYIKITVHLSPCPVPLPIHIPNVLCCRTNNISCQRPWGHRRTKQMNKTNYN